MKKFTKNISEPYSEILNPKIKKIRTINTKNRQPQNPSTQCTRSGFSDHGYTMALSYPGVVWGKNGICSGVWSKRIKEQWVSFAWTILSPRVRRRQSGRREGPGEGRSWGPRKGVPKKAKTVRQFFENFRNSINTSEFLSAKTDVQFVKTLLFNDQWLVQWHERRKRRSEKRRDIRKMGFAQCCLQRSMGPNETWPDCLLISVQKSTWSQMKRIKVYWGWLQYMAKSDISPKIKKTCITALKTKRWIYTIRETPGKQHFGISLNAYETPCRRFFKNDGNLKHTRNNTSHRCAITYCVQFYWNP